jgi:hypothetical protein
MPIRNLKFCSLVLTMLFLDNGANPSRAEKPETDDRAIHLFNGKDFDTWYVFTTETGYKNPDVFQVVDGMIHVPGGKGKVAYFGGLITKQSYDNFRLRFQYKWGEATFGTRKDKARDSGIMLHCTGENQPGPWMTSYEFQIIEGGTGDLLVVDSRGVGGVNSTVLSGKGEIENRNRGMYFKPDAPLAALQVGDRLNWWGRDPEWKDEAGFRGKRDVESRRGEWTKCEIVARGDTLEYYVNDKLVNRAVNLSVSRGKIFLQTEGAEVWYRNIELIPLRR